jgi:hypothetical protein
MPVIVGSALCARTMAESPLALGSGTANVGGQERRPIS